MYGFRISKPSINVQDSTPKDRIIDSDIACLKIVQSGREDFTINNGVTTTYEFPITTSFPILPLVYVYQSDLARYKPSGPIMWGNYFSEYLHTRYEFTATTLYVTINNGTGGAVTSHFYWYICYA